MERNNEDQQMQRHAEEQRRLSDVFLTLLSPVLRLSSLFISCGAAKGKSNATEHMSCINLFLALF